LCLRPVRWATSAADRRGTPKAAANTATRASCAGCNNAGTKFQLEHHSGYHIALEWNISSGKISRLMF